MHIYTKNIAIRDWQPKDIPIIRHWYSGHHEWMEMDVPYFTKPSEELLDKRIQAYNDLCSTQNVTHVRKNLVIAFKDELIGNINWYYTSKETNWISIGISIFDTEHHGKGFGSEALAAWTCYLFDSLPHIVRLDLYTWSGNIAMQKCALRIGYKEEARFRNARIVDGKHYDSIGLGILREEWDEIKETMKMKYHIHM